MVMHDEDELILSMNYKEAFDLDFENAYSSEDVQGL